MNKFFFEWQCGVIVKANYCTSMSLIVALQANIDKIIHALPYIIVDSGHGLHVYGIYTPDF